MIVMQAVCRRNVQGLLSPIPINVGLHLSVHEVVEYVHILSTGWLNYEAGPDGATFQVQNPLYTARDKFRTPL